MSSLPAFTFQKPGGARAITAQVITSSVVHCSYRKCLPGRRPQRDHILLTSVACIDRKDESGSIRHQILRSLKLGGQECAESTCDHGGLVELVGSASAGILERETAVKVWTGSVHQIMNPKIAKA